MTPPPTADGRANPTTVAAAAEEAASNVNTVAAAAEELGSSVQEIGRQVDGSAEPGAGAPSARPTRPAPSCRS